MAADVGGDGGGGKKKGKKGRKKRANPRIDMTPMVDLGFLLLTFFVLTTTMSTPSTMPVIVPSDKNENEPEPEPEEIDKVSEEKVLFLLLTGKDRIYWYRGIKDIELNKTQYSGKKSVRDIIFQERKKVNESGLFDLSKDPNPMITLIKMSDDCSYENMVDILDEMNITEQKKYMLLDMKPRDVELVKDYEEDQGLELSIQESIESIGLPEGSEG